MNVDIRGFVLVTRSKFRDET